MTRKLIKSLCAVDAEFCASVVHQKLDFQARLEDVCQGEIGRAHV